jgi:8-oxo-dGTP pyrophosphatase MutT (NUDIX family)
VTCSAPDPVADPTAPEPELAPVPVASRGGPQHIPRPPGTRRGGPPPWAALPESRRRPTIDQVRRALERGPAPRRSPVEALTNRYSAVLAPLYEHEGDVHVVLTRRAWHMRSHTGEVSFPGGKQEPGESLWQTALRESTEEIGLDPTAVEHVGELHHLATVTSRASIVPYVGVLPDRPDLVPNPDEVDAILHVPLAELMEPDVYRQERWGVPGIDRPIHFFEIVGDTIWGATGSMLVDLLLRITAEEP